MSTIHEEFVLNYPNPIEEDIEAMDWRDVAACRNQDPSVFFPAGETGPAVEQIKFAKRMCSECPVIEECLAFAIETNQVSGIWGGLTEDERRPVRRRWLADRRRR